MKRVSIFLIAVALVAAVAGCKGIFYDVTISSSAGGSVTVPGEGIFTYEFCTEVSLVATPDSGYRFVKWTGDVEAIADVNSASTIITSVQGNYFITANFEQIPPGQFGLTVSSTAGGSVTVPGEGTFIYDAGTVVNLVAAPAGSYQFDNWTGDVGTIADVNSASTTVAMEGNYSITANFDVIPPAIPPLFTVGLTCYTVNKLAVMAPWIALGAAIVVGASLLVLRRRRVRDRGV